MITMDYRLYSKIQSVEMELEQCRSEIDMIKAVLESITPEEFFDTN